jgi:hypothetical protein
VGKKAVDKNLYYAKWEIPFKEGKIRAIGYRNNKKVTEHLLQTADKATGFKIHQIKRVWSQVLMTLYNLRYLWWIKTTLLSGCIARS